MAQDRDSLDRFLQSRGAIILGRSMAQSYKVHAIVGSSITALGVGFLVSPLFGAPVEVMGGAIGPLIAGTMNILMAVGTKRRLSSSQPGQVEYSTDARTLLMALYRQTAGGFTAFGRPRVNTLAHVPAHVARHAAMANMRSQMPEPGPELVAHLERAAEAYQRVAAVLAMGKTQPSIAKLGPRASLAAEEAMAEIFHNAASLCRYPEGIEAGRKPLEAQIDCLCEIAVGLESLSAAGAEPARINRSNVDDLLTDLRLEQLARTELRPLRSDDGESVKE